MYKKDTAEQESTKDKNFYFMEHEIYMQRNAKSPTKKCIMSNCLDCPYIGLNLIKKDEKSLNLEVYCKITNNELKLFTLKIKKPTKTNSKNH